MPRFTTKDLLISTALIGLGVIMISTLFKHPPEPGPPIMRGAFPFFLLWFGGGAMIGAGVLKPFKQGWLGASVGFIIQVFLLITTDVYFYLM
jgi:hypothetical protein